MPCANREGRRMQSHDVSVGVPFRLSIKFFRVSSANRCGAQICWNCMATFANANAVYDHLRQVHGGYGSIWSGHVLKHPTKLDFVLTAVFDRARMKWQRNVLICGQEVKVHTRLNMPLARPARLSHGALCTFHQKLSCPASSS